MFAFNKITIITLLASICSLQAEENLKVFGTEPNQMGVLTQLKTISTKSGDALYGYKCTVGQKKTVSLACTGGDGFNWSTPQNVQLTLRCPKSGVTRPIAYAEVDFVVSTQSVGCVVSAGGIGYNFIELKINAWGTVKFDYASKIYVN